MKLRQFGQSGLQVSEIGLGLAALGRPGYINLGHQKDLESAYDSSIMAKRASEVLSEAYHLGIRYLDTARSYGKGEVFLADWFNSTKFSNLIIGSKWGYHYTADWKVDAKVHEVKEHTLPRLQQQWNESQSILGEHLSIYHIHSATLESGVLENEAVLDYLRKIKSTGIIIGLSVSGIHQAETIKKSLEIRDLKGELLFQSVQVTWNILEQSTTSVLEKAAKLGVGVIVKESLANGRLTDRNAEPEFKSTLDQIHNMAQQLHVSIDALAIAYVLHQPWVSTVLSGATTIPMLRSNIQASNVIFSQKQLNTLANLEEKSAAYWTKRSNLTWN